MVLLVCAEVPIGIAAFSDLLPLKCVRYAVEADRVRPPSDADRNADRRLRYLWVQRAGVLPGSGNALCASAAGVAKRARTAATPSERISEAAPPIQPVQPA